jgi:glycosyltransferase involved in cell wall biosynthesis
MATRAKKLPAKQARPASAPAAGGVAVATREPLSGAELRIHGSLDRVDPDGLIEGWAWSPDEPDVQRPLLVMIDDVEVARLVADNSRADLANAGVGKGHHAFRHMLDPAVLRPGLTSTVMLRDLRTRQQVGGGVSVQWGAAVRKTAPTEARMSRLLHGNLDRVSRDGWVSGWCWYPDYPDEHVELAVLVDDQPVGTMLASNFRPDLQHAGIGDGSHGFSFALPYAALADKGTLKVAVQDAHTGRALSEPITVRLGRMAAAEDRIQDLERQVRLLRGHIEDLTRLGAARDEDRAARELFSTVAAFFTDLAQGESGRGGAPREFGAAGLAGALEEVASRYAAITLAAPAEVSATVFLAATAGFDSLYRCIAALHDAGVDDAADIVVLDDGQHGGYGALLPSVIRNLRYVHLRDAGSLINGRNEAMRDARGALMAFLSPEVRVLPGWLSEIVGTFAREPDAAIVGCRLVREDGLLQHAGLVASEDGGLRDLGHLAPAERPEHRFMRRVDAVAGLAFAVRREVLREVGGFSDLYRHFGHAVADLCARLRDAGHPILYQPVAAALWVERGVMSGDGDVPDLSLPDEETLRLRERVRHEGWPAGPTSARFIGHALVIDDDLPRPDRDAGSIATFEQMILLRRLGWRVTFSPVHALTLEPAEADSLARQGIEVAGPPNFGSVTQYLQAHGGELDLVHVYRYSNAAMLLDRVRDLAPRAKIVFATADLHFLREQRRAELSGQAPAAAAREEELRCMDAADATIITSDHELAVLRDAIDPAKLVLLRWIARPRPRPNGFADRRDICFVGNFRHPPNLDGVQWFLSAVFPLVRAALPKVRLKLAGSGMPTAISDLSMDGVDVLGWVEDLAGLFGAARLSVAPLRFGAGFKGKVATSLAHGLPVVGSSISLEGTGLHHGDGVAVADTPGHFVREIVRLHEDATWWEAQSARALERVGTLYSPAAATEVWRRMLEGLALPAW